LRRNGLRSVKVKIQTSNIRQVEKDSQVRNFSNLWNAGRGTEAATIGIELSVGRSRRAKLTDELAREAEELAVFGDLFESMLVRGRDDQGELRTINLKKERIRAPIDVPAGTSTTQVYRKIVRARRAVEKRITSLDHAARGS